MPSQRKRKTYTLTQIYTTCKSLETALRTRTINVTSNNNYNNNNNNNYKCTKREVKF